MIEPERKLAGLLVLILAHLALGLVVYASGFAGASGDDFFRALMAYEWSQAPYLTSDSFGLCSVLWFPTHFWITGFFYMLSGGLALSLTGMSILFSVAGLFLLYKIAEELFDGERGFFTILLVVFIPWHVWLSISMTDMTMFFSAVVGAFLFWIRWEKERRRYQAPLAAFLFMLATMFRPEAWIFSVLFSARIVVCLVRGGFQNAGAARAIFSVFVPGVFILFWLGRNFLEFGDPLYFIHVSKAHIGENVDVASIRPWIKGLKYPFLMLLVSPLLFVLTLTGLFVPRSASERVRMGYCLMILAQLAVLMAASAYGMGTKAAPQRYVMIHVLLLSPFAGHALSLLWKKKRWVGALIVLLYIGLNTFKSFHPPTGYEDARKVGLYLNERFSTGDLSPGDRVCTEISLRRLTGRYITSDPAFYRLASSHAALAACSERPRAFLVNILEMEKAELMAPGGSIAAAGVPVESEDVHSRLRELNVNKIVLENRELMELIPQDFVLEKMVGSWAIFSSREGRGKPEWPEIEINEKAVFQATSLGRGISLVGFEYKGGVLPRGIALYWRIDGGFESRKNRRLKMVFTSIRNADESFERIVRPIFHWRDLDSASGVATLEDVVPLTPPPGIPSGEYSLRLMLTEMLLPGSGSGKTSGFSHASVDLPPVTLVSAKRDVLVDCIKGKCADWKLLVKTLLIL